jgi:hypothetical protein
MPTLTASPAMKARFERVAPPLPAPLGYNIFVPPDAEGKASAELPSVAGAPGSVFIVNFST